MDISDDNDEFDEKHREENRKKTIQREFVERAVALISLDLAKNIEKDVLKVPHFSKARHQFFAENRLGWKFFSSKPKTRFGWL